MRFSLRTKFVLLVGLLVAAFGLLVTAVNIHTQEAQIRQRLLDKAEALTSLMAKTATDPLARLDLNQLRLFLANVRENPEVLYAYVLDGAGRVISDGTLENSKRNKPLDDEVGRAGDAETSGLTRDARCTADSLEVIEPIYLGSKQLGAVRLGILLQVMKAEIVRTRNQNVALGLVAIVASILCTIYFIRSVTRPLLELTRATVAVSDGSFDQHLTITTGDELEILCHSFNQMSERLRDTTVSRDDLERLVAERTAELSEANDLLVMQVAERTRAEQQLERLAFYDVLSNLPNRALFLDRLGHALRRAARHDRSVGVMFVDLDNFKVVNDGLGHHAGDRLIATVAECLRACLRTGDTAARFGGDEFTILLEDIRDERDAITVAEGILAALRVPIELGGHEMIPTASIGIAISAPGHDTSDALLRNADLAMYRAKAAGKSRYAMFNHSMSAAAIERLELEVDLRRAIDRDELRIVYQPIVALDTQTVTEMEALLRWVHPTRGVLPPSDFIPLAEQSGAIVRLTEAVLETALTARDAWAAAGHDLVVSVNLSPRSLLDRRLPQRLTSIIERTGSRPDRLELEVTESMLMADPQRATQLLETLRAMGITIAMDDFGTGHSSLERLRRLPVDVVKVDRSFVSAMSTDETDSMIVRTTIELCHHLGLSVVAEGVEDQETLDRLRAWGCDGAQGYHLGRPVPADAFALDLLAVAPV